MLLFHTSYANDQNYGVQEIKDFFSCSGTFIDWHDKFQDNECQTILTSACLIRNPDYPYDGGSKIIDGLRVGALDYFLSLFLPRYRLNLIISFADSSVVTRQGAQRRDINKL